MFALPNNRGAHFTRWLSLLLVVFILFGTTVEAAHRHGRWLPSVTTTASHVESQPTSTLSTKPTSCNDCLICQLHQNLTTMLIALRLKHEPTARARQQVTAAVPEDLLSQVISPLSGRAPPQAN